MSWNVWENRKCVWWPPLIFGGKRKWRLSLLSSSSMLKKNFGRLLTRENRITGLRCLRLLTFLRFELLYDVGKRSFGTKNPLLINFLLATAAMIKHNFEFRSLSQFSSLQNAMIGEKFLMLLLSLTPDSMLTNLINSCFTRGTEIKGRKGG